MEQTQRTATDKESAMPASRLRPRQANSPAKMVNQIVKLTGYISWGKSLDRKKLI